VDQPLGDWVPDGYYADPANPGKSRYWSRREHQWRGKPSGQAPQPIPPQPVDWNALTAGALAVIGRIVVLGGYGFELKPGTAVLLSFRDDALDIWLSGESKLSYSYGEITELEVDSHPVDDPVQEGSTGAFFAGGVAASMEVDRLNHIIASTARMTLVRVATDTMEMFLEAKADKPLALRMRISEARARILRARSVARLSS
jgi:hypothetical protein